MNAHIDTLVGRHARAGLIVDTNLLLVLLIGSYKLERISSFKRTAMYTPADYALLTRFALRFARLVTTPYLLAEVNSLSNQLREDEKGDYYAVVQRVTARFYELYTPSAALMIPACFLQFGLTDASLLSAAQHPYLVLTDDYRLSGYMLRQRMDVLNFGDLRI